MALADSNFWRERGLEFWKLLHQKSDLRAERVRSFYSGVPPEEHVAWFLPSDDDLLRVEFEALACKAASAIAHQEDPKGLLEIWLEQLNRPEYADDPEETTLKKDLNGKLWSESRITISRALKASMHLCKRFEATALELERGPHGPLIASNEHRSALPKAPSQVMPPVKTAEISPQPQVPETIAQQLNRLRKECKWTAAELAEEIKVEPRTVQRHLAGDSIPYKRHISAYERVFSKQLKTKIIIKKMS